MEYKEINERLMHVKRKIGRGVLLIVSMYAPQAPEKQDIRAFLDIIF